MAVGLRVSANVPRKGSKGLSAFPLRYNNIASGPCRKCALIKGRLLRYEKLSVYYTYLSSHKNICQTYRDTDRQPGRHRGRQTDTQTDKQTDIII